MAGELAEYITIYLLPDIAASRHSKKLPVFWKLFLQNFANQDKPARTAGSKQGGQSVLNDLLT